MTQHIGFIVVEAALIVIIATVEVGVVGIEEEVVALNYDYGCDYNDGCDDHDNGDDSDDDDDHDNSCVFDCDYDYNINLIKYITVAV